MSINEELELIAKDCEEIGFEIDKENGGDTTLDSRAWYSIASRIRFAIKRLDK